MKQKRPEKIVISPCKSEKRVLKIVLCLLTIAIATVAVVFAISLIQIADPLVTLNAPTNGGRPTDITSAEYDELIKDKKSFVIMVDNTGCRTTSHMREMLNSLPEDQRFSYYRIMWEDAMKTNLYDHIKYYPSLAIIKNGEIKYYLQADKDEDAEYYNDQSALSRWLKERINFKR